ncbi:hypothetical protein SEMRO_3796_G351110.1 [Seminavis robusta]|uniref:Uncharacterized protein n=1 Tax=Seminavis robusta TaxID=568900 RepID=A0A9N8F0Y0_9STRA|nr:hypothetical protein SEMRO_3796_G351110.1 [Seminavis robusta]|eukprot:Sro3796_g351110.1 n/a (123) ;mRNA; f:3083-3451
MSQEKRSLSEYSLEELEVEVKRRRLESGATATNSTNSNTLSIQTAREILSSYLLPSDERVSRGDSFQSDHAINLLRQHPSLVAESFGGQTVLSAFLRAGAYFYSFNHQGAVCHVEISQSSIQ